MTSPNPIPPVSTALVPYDPTLPDKSSDIMLFLLWKRSSANRKCYLSISVSKIGRMLYYRKCDHNENPYWCGAHFDHGLFTVILPAVYFIDGEQVSEPLEAGLFVRTSEETPFKKVVADDLDVMMFQVEEFGQLVRDDGIPCYRASRS